VPTKQRWRCPSSSSHSSVSWAAFPVYGAELVKTVTDF